MKKKNIIYNIVIRVCVVKDVKIYLYTLKKILLVLGCFEIDKNFFVLT
jgi:hypothetical protein